MRVIPLPMFGQASSPLSRRSRSEGPTIGPRTDSLGYAGLPSQHEQRRRGYGYFDSGAPVSPRFEPSPVSTAGEIGLAFATSRSPLHLRERLNPASTTSWAGVRPSITAPTQNHISSSSGPRRAPPFHFELQRKARGHSCPPRTDPITFRHLEREMQSESLPGRTLRRQASTASRLDSSNAVGSWSLRSCNSPPLSQVLVWSTSENGFHGGRDDMNGLPVSGVRKCPPYEMPGSPVLQRQHALRLPWFARPEVPDDCRSSPARRENPQLRESRDLRECLQPEKASASQSSGRPREVDGSSDQVSTSGARRLRLFRDPLRPIEATPSTPVSRSSAYQAKAPAPLLLPAEFMANPG